MLARDTMAHGIGQLASTHIVTRAQYSTYSTKIFSLENDDLISRFTNEILQCQVKMNISKGCIEHSAAAD